MQQFDRERRFHMFVGGPGSGKTSFIAKGIKEYNNGNVCMMKHVSNIHDAATSFLPVKTTSNWRQGAHSPDDPVKFLLPIMDKKDYKEKLQWVRTKYRNGLLIVDDATIFERDRLTEAMNEAVTMRRHWGIDIWLVYHGMTLLPIEQFIFANWLIIFNCTDNLNYKRNKITDADEIQAAVDDARRTFNSYRDRDPRKYQPEIVALTQF